MKDEAGVTAGTELQGEPETTADDGADIVDGVEVESVPETPDKKPVEGDEFVPNPLGVVPIVEFRNRPRLLGEGRSEIADVISVQNQINKLVCDMMIAAEFSAFKQRWATGVEIPTDPMTGEPLQAFPAAIERLWAVESEAAKFGELFDGETLEAATNALLEASVDFLPQGRREVIRKLWGKADEVATAAAELMEASVDGLTMESLGLRPKSSGST
jgi:hypothetical protein